MSRPSVTERIAGGLLGLAAGDALGATVEFLSPTDIGRRHGRHVDIVGGGVFGWRPGEGTDDTDLAYAVARSYVEGYSLSRVADAFLAWYDRHPRDVGCTTSAGLLEYSRHHDPRHSGVVVARSTAAGNGSLMRCVATGLVRPHTDQRRQEAAEISAITHGDRRCVQACVAYCDLVACLLEEAAPTEAVAHVLLHSPIGADLAEAIARARSMKAAELDTSGYVLATLQVAVWALLQRQSLEQLLIAIVNRGGDADTTGAVAGALLGVRDGMDALPQRWLTVLEYRETLESAVPHLAALRHGERPPALNQPQ